jgi:glycosyltransferase involved in cell wall biosynthesis
MLDNSLSRKKNQTDKTLKVSVCVVTYNQERYIRQCLQSIIDQEVDFDYEVIIADDFSSDNTANIIREFHEKYPKIIRPFFHVKNIGALKNFVFAHGQAFGQYVSHIDGDDVMLPLKLQKQVDFLDKNLKCNIVAHNMRLIDAETGLAIGESFHYQNVPECANLNYLVKTGCYFANSSSMYRALSGNENKILKPKVDFYCHIEHLGQGLIGYINETLGEYRRGNISISHTKNPQNNTVIESYLEAYSMALKIGVSHNIVMTACCNFKYVNSMVMLKHGEYERFQKLIKLKFNEVRYATARHLIILILSPYPELILWIEKYLKNK